MVFSQAKLMALSRVRGWTKGFLQNRYAADHFLWRLPATEGSVISLTFDDGPDPQYTLPLLEILAVHDVKATFFMIGEMVDRHPDIAAQIVREGHAVAGHTYTHRELPSLSEPELNEELDKTRLAIQRATGIDSFDFRPPRGRMSAASLGYLKKTDYRLIHWSKTYSDYLKDGADKLIERINSNPMVAGDVILFHDNNSHSLEAMERILPQLKQQGLGFYHFSA
ncbi:MAG: polysaccharide deacetylase family protein [Gammaproteobacteria bacterium]|nr:polysaccharide deacetylase family protein [Gammaproteobacteria bacterium]